MALDARGDNIDSAGFAGHFQKWRADGRTAAAFLIGDANSLAPSRREQAELRLAFGAATWSRMISG